MRASIEMVVFTLLMVVVFAFAIGVAALGTLGIWMLFTL